MRKRTHILVVVVTLPIVDSTKVRVASNQQVRISCNREVKRSLAFEDVRTSSAEVVLTTKCNKIPLPETNHHDFINLCTNKRRRGMGIHMSQECKPKTKTHTRLRE